MFRLGTETFLHLGWTMGQLHIYIVRSILCDPGSDRYVVFTEDEFSEFAEKFMILF